MYLNTYITNMSTREFQKYFYLNRRSVIIVKSKDLLFYVQQLSFSQHDTFFNLESSASCKERLMRYLVGILKHDVMELLYFVQEKCIVDTCIY